MTTTTRQGRQIAEAPQSGDVLPGGIREAAKRLGIGERKAYRLAEKGAYPFSLFSYKAGSTYICPRAAFERFLRGELTPPTDTQPGARNGAATLKNDAPKEAR